MIESGKYDDYPLWIVALSNLLSISIYGLGFFIMVRVNWIIAILYLIYIMILEYRLLKNGCVNCYYRGKVCGFGKGIISSWLFKKGDISKFCSHEISWKDMIPDLLISLIPFIIGIVLITIEFDFIIFCVLVLLAFLTTTGNGFIRTKLTCKYCGQKELGCPADKLFNKNKNITNNA